ncbi:hypothetical protein Bca4012_027438 [Brassica carinata]
MMAVRAWFSELTLCVTLGPEDVARYQFMCRTNFNIRASSFVFGNESGDPSFEAFLGETVVASQFLLEQYFDDQEMLIIHRVHLEMKKAKLDLENQRTMEFFQDKEIILLDDDSDSEPERAQPLGSQQVSLPVFGDCLTDPPAVVSNQANTPLQTIGDIGLDTEKVTDPGLPNVENLIDEELCVLSTQAYPDTLGVVNLEFSTEEHFTTEPLAYGGLDDRTDFWENPQANSTHFVRDAGSSTDSTPDLKEIRNVVHPSNILSQDVMNTQPMYENTVISEGNIDENVEVLTANKMPEISSTAEVIPVPINFPSKTATQNELSKPVDLGLDPVINLSDSSSNGSLDVGGF